MKPKDAFLSDGHVSEAMLALLSDSLLQNRTAAPEHVPPDVLDHVDQCSQCKDNIMDVVLFMGDPKPDRIQEKRTGETIPITMPQKNRFFFPGKIAAVFVALAVTVAAFYFVNNNPLPTGNDVKEITGPTQPILEPDVEETDNNEEKQVQKNLPAVNDKNTPNPRYTVNPSLENMVDSRMRGILPEALTPENNSVQKGAIRFSWVNAFDTSLTLKILDNKNDVLHSFPVSGDFLEFEGKLENGLYYWKLENENELFHVGKFFVGKAP